MAPDQLRKSNMKSSTALKKVRKHLVKDYDDHQDMFSNSPFICYVIEDLNCQGDIPGDLADKLKSHVQLILLKGHYTLEAWYRKVHPNLYGKLDRMTPRDQFNTLQKIRCDWLDWMIQEFEAKGD
jgi:hypothetical protein